VQRVEWFGLRAAPRLEWMASGCRISGRMRFRFVEVSAPSRDSNLFWNRSGVRGPATDGRLVFNRHPFRPAEVRANVRAPAVHGENAGAKAVPLAPQFGILHTLEGVRADD